MSLGLGIRLGEGLGLVLLGLLAWLLRTHVRALRFYDRPAPARGRLFDPALLLASWVLIGAGLVVIGRASAAAAIAIALVLALLWAWRAVIRSVFFQRRLLRRDLAALKGAHPGQEERVLLCQLVYRRHPAWGEELIEQMVLDYPTVEELARMVAKMERGFRGFRP